MQGRNEDWTGKFVAKALQDHTEVLDVELLAPQVLQVVRKDDPSFLAGTVAAERVQRSTIEPLLSGDFDIEFIANVPRESYWTGEAIRFASEREVAFGGMGDLLSTISWPDVRRYVKKEFEFVERGLRQHTRVQNLQRVDDRLYLVN